MVRFLAIVVVAAAVAIGGALGLRLYKPCAAVNYTVFLVQEGRRVEAIEHARAASAKFPSEKRLLQVLAAIHLSNGDVADARAALDRLGENSPAILRALVDFHEGTLSAEISAEKIAVDTGSPYLFMTSEQARMIAETIAAWAAGDSYAALRAARRAVDIPRHSPAWNALKIINAASAHERGARREAGAILDRLLLERAPWNDALLVPMVDHLIASERDDRLALWLHENKRAPLSDAALATLSQALEYRTTDEESRRSIRAKLVRAAGRIDLRDGDKLDDIAEMAKPVFDIIESQEHQILTFNRDEPNNWQFRPGAIGRLAESGASGSAALDQFSAGILHVDVSDPDIAGAGEYNELFVVAGATDAEGEWPIVSLKVNGRRVDDLYIFSELPYYYRRQIDLPSEEIESIELQFINNAISPEAVARGEDRNVRYFGIYLRPASDAALLTAPKGASAQN